MKKAQQAQQVSQLKEFSSDEPIVPKSKPRVDESYRTPSKSIIADDEEEEKKMPVQQQ